MSSILTNTSAMTALQTLKMINKNLATTQNEVSTGKRISTAKDNAAMWAISSVMDTDVKGFEALNDSLALGDSTIGVARDGAETVVELLNEMKARIVAAQENNVDRSKIQAEVSQLRDQIQAVVDGSQFNGLNLLKYDASNTDISILASLNRNDSGVSTSSIAVNHIGLGVTADVGGVTDQIFTLAQTNSLAGSVTIDASNLTVGSVIRVSMSEDGAAYANANTYTVTAQDLADPNASEVIASAVAAAFTGTAADLHADQEAITVSRTDATITYTRGGTADGGILQVDILNGAARSETFSAGASQDFATIDETATGDIALIKGTVVTMSVAGVVAQYSVTQADLDSATTDEAVALGIVTEMNKQLVAAGIGDVSVARKTGTLETIQVTSTKTTDITATLTTGNSKLSAIGAYDVSTEAGAKAALDGIDGMIQAAVDAAAEFGSVQKRIEIQAEFVSKVKDSLTTGIGQITDADMEETSARLQALQVQQQLGVQALSIANQAPQTLLALFR